MAVRGSTAIFFMMVLLGAACSQIAPPHSASTMQGLTTSSGNLNQIDRSPDPIIHPREDRTLLRLDLNDQGRAQLVLEGVDAEKVYRLLEIAPEVNGAFSLKQMVKTGRDFFCALNSSVHYSCEFQIQTPKGESLQLRAEDQLLRFAPEMPQIAESNAYLRIEAPELRGKIRLQILGSFAERLFQSLSVERTYDLIPDAENGPGVRKLATQMDCWMTTRLKAPTQKNYACYLYLDATNGSIDKLAALVGE